MNKNDIRYTKTATKMNKALLTLLEKKDYEYITIKEICDEAQVNRSTFYLHYDTVSDLLRETTQYATDSFLSYFVNDKKDISFNFETCSFKDLFFLTPEYIVPFLTYIKDNRKIFTVAMKNLESMNFMEVYQRMFKHIFSPILERFDFPEAEKSYVMKFYLSGIASVISEWLEKDCEDSMDTISHVIFKCIINDPNKMK